MRHTGSQDPRTATTLDPSNTPIKIRAVSFAGSVASAQKVASLTRWGQLLSVAGGGDTVAALAHAGVEEDFTYVSTAGGAFLEWLEGKELPGVQALSTR